MHVQMHCIYAGSGTRCGRRGVVQMRWYMCGHTQVRDVWYRCWYMWAQPGGSVGKSRPFPAPQPPLPLVNHNWCARPFRNMTCVCSWGKPKHQREKKRQNWADDCMTILHFLMHLQQHQQLLESEEPH